MERSTRVHISTYGTILLFLLSFIQLGNCSTPLGCGGDPAVPCFNGTCCTGTGGGKSECCGVEQICEQVPGGNKTIGLCCPKGDVWCTHPKSIFDTAGEDVFCCNPDTAIKKGVEAGLVEGALSLLIFIVTIGSALRKRKLRESGVFRQNKRMYIFACISGLISVLGEMLIWMGAFGSPFGIHAFTVGVLVIFIFILRTLWFNVMMTIRKGNFGSVPFMFWGCFGCSAFVFLALFALLIIFLSALGAWDPHCSDFPSVTIDNMPSLKPRTCHSFKYASIGLTLVCLSLGMLMGNSIYFYRKHSKLEAEYRTFTAIATRTSSNTSVQ